MSGDRYHWVFDLCVAFLLWTAKRLDPIWPGGMDYVKINVILFCFVLPVVFAASIALNVVFLLLWLKPWS